MKVGIIGAGNMAQALLMPLKTFFDDQKINIYVYTPSGTRAKILATHFDGNVAGELKDLNDSDLLILCHKPQQLLEVSEMISVNENCGVISMLASIDVAQIEKSFGVKKVLRLMPNTPAQVGLGVVTYFYRERYKNYFSHFINAFGNDSRMHQFLDESLIDLTTPELGSGPGMVLELIRVFSASLVQKGLDEAQAVELASMVFYGSGKLALSSDESPTELRNKVTSKGGITHECLEVMKEKNIENIFHQAFKAGHNRAIELKK